MHVLMDKEKWSESSKRSFAYSGSKMTHYENISYRCAKCSQPSIFTAEEQKIRYEELQQFIWRRRTLCSACYLNLENIRDKDRQFQKEWAANKAKLTNDYRFLFDWLEILESVSTYGKQANRSMIAMLKKLAHQCG
jgi:hypothetical protein